MPSTVASLLASVGLEPIGCVRWEQPVAENRPGVYIVSLTSIPDRVDCVHATAPLSDAALDRLLAVCDDLTLDGEPRPRREQLAERIGSYWLPDEGVLYIGLAGQSLRKRVRQYYKTPLGGREASQGRLVAEDAVGARRPARPLRRDAGLQVRRGKAATRLRAGASDVSRAALPAGGPDALRQPDAMATGAGAPTASAEPQCRPVANKAAASPSTAAAAEAQP